MTDYDSMEAGYKIDWLVHTKVMGGDEREKDVGNEGYGFCPSTNIVHAWEVVQKLRGKADGHFTLLAFTTEWRAGCGTITTHEEIQKMARGPTAALAICRAALKAME